MTTEELVKRLNTNNWLNWVDAELEVNKYGESYVTIYSPFGSEEIAVPCDATNWLNVHYDWSTSSDEFTAPMREFISSLISQYLNTPVSKRKTEKKYRLRWLDSDDPKLDHETYLSRNWLDSGGYNWVISNKDTAEIFSRHGLEKFKDENANYAMIIDAMKEEVKNDEN